MSTAFPVNTQGHISGHLGKSPRLLVVGGESPRWIDNPMNADTCSGRCKLLAALQEAGVSRLLVRHIGQRTLGRFLRAGLEVYRLPRGMMAPPEGEEVPAGAEPLTRAEQGRPSKPRSKPSDSAAATP
ncbi:NifB/NifX family molybdenum-iron cluster-binding protein [Halomonas mongoliensis]|uniref:NifB/NifX family molybdenum-iron cluster-binding protein n=1 Tax=Halomonas mongoliensis TaxID=321265 RepID=UPI00403B10ED